MGEKSPELSRGHGLSIEALVFYGEEAIEPHRQTDDCPCGEQSQLLDLKSLLYEIKEYRKTRPSLEPTIDLSFSQ